tara:strand:+ start:298 stop:414 length:117 start_codon:yes stop_codon:yes gene_type:complete
MNKILKDVNKQFGAEEAREAHNLKVNGSKPLIAINSFG